MDTTPAARPARPPLAPVDTNELLEMDDTVVAATGGLTGEAAEVLMQLGRGDPGDLAVGARGVDAAADSYRRATPTWAWPLQLARIDWCSRVVLAAGHLAWS